MFDKEGYVTGLKNVLIVGSLDNISYRTSFSLWNENFKISFMWGIILDYSEFLVGRWREQKKTHRLAWDKL